MSHTPNAFGRKTGGDGTNTFGVNFLLRRPHDTGMEHEAYLDGLDAPSERAVSFLDVRELPPPEPLTETMNRLAALDGETVFVQLNDREPKFLYPKLDDRGFAYCSAEREDGVVTAIWEP
ncbi:MULTISPECIES: DUF2249 domain-containing protein [Haloferax]|uniref:DUF2249 family protein n=2 Tax=Haloferax gibbonsii TaxID=35746 RepID=A0A871BJD4_HALGI|nr:MULTISPECIES: DUF2249 domain-containing protein [Haloferax]QOS12834.1 DUF2249 family protein [Haloferax gibbonsii]REA02112.1 DUF2249 domain-containing protein [Haloferax sp. Atlit-6N]